MQINYSETADAAYIQLAPNALVARTVEVDVGTLVDVDESGSPVGIEVIRPARRWPIEEVLDRFEVAVQDVAVIRSLWGFEDETDLRFPYGEPAAVA